MKNTTLCYIENERGEYLMLHRVKKQNDLNHDKWIGVGGGVRLPRDAGGDGPDPDRLSVPGRHHLCVGYLGGGIYAPVYRHRLDRDAAGMR